MKTMERQEREENIRKTERLVSGEKMKGGKPSLFAPFVIRVRGVGPQAIFKTFPNPAKIFKGKIPLLYTH
jgi:hypothetical protein